VVLQRVAHASVNITGETVASIGIGLLLLVGIEDGDGPATVHAAVDKISGLRVFPDDDDRMNRSVIDVDGDILVVSQFTLLGDVSRGRRPSFTAAAAPELAAPLIDSLVAGFRAAGVRTETGVFGASMLVDLANDGPVTLVLDFPHATQR
jgi:D-aminoacyl-tRNA deacylase